MKQNLLLLFIFCLSLYQILIVVNEKVKSIAKICKNLQKVSSFLFKPQIKFD